MQINTRRITYFFAILNICFSSSLLAGSHLWVSDSQDLVYSNKSGTTWNGHIIYLSTPRHIDGQGPRVNDADYPNGSRGECTGTGKSENLMGLRAAVATAKIEQSGGTGYFPLTKRTYITYVGKGKPTTAVIRSNLLTPQPSAHVVMHSNSFNNYDCTTSATPTNYTPGTKVAYWVQGSSTSVALAQKLATHVGNASPGSNDVAICTGQINSSISCCPNGFSSICNFPELRDTVAPAAYLESEFHSWPPGSDFVDNYWGYGYRVAESIDFALGYPRN